MESDSLQEANNAFMTASECKIRSAVLYNGQTQAVLKVAIDGPPIHLVRAIELARSKDPAETVEDTEAGRSETKANAGIKIAEIANAILENKNKHPPNESVITKYINRYYNLMGMSR